MSAHEQFADDLALLALGSLDLPERMALEEHLRECAACRRELEELRGDLSLLSLAASGPKPPARARQRLLTAIGKEPRRLRIVQEKRGLAWTLGWIAVAALIILSFGLAIQNGALHRDLDNLKARDARQQSDLQQAKEIMATLLDPEAQRVTLVALKAAPQPQGKAIYRRRNRSLIFLASNLPPLPPEKIYELWLIPTSGAPIPAGLFKPDAKGSATVVNPPLPEGVEAKNFAVTLEEESGSHEAPRGSFVIVGAGE
jgi:anti-sigma-K factor RskA